MCKRLGRPERFCQFFEPAQSHLVPREHAWSRAFRAQIAPAACCEELRTISNDLVYGIFNIEMWFCIPRISDYHEYLIL